MFRTINDYQCDWCKAIEPAVPVANTLGGRNWEPPVTWRYLEALGFEVDLCEVCAVAAREALLRVEGQRERAAEPKSIAEDPK